ELLDIFDPARPGGLGKRAPGHRRRGGGGHPVSPLVLSGPPSAPVPGLSGLSRRGRRPAARARTVVTLLRRHHPSPARPRPPIPASLEAGAEVIEQHETARARATSDDV